MAIDILSGRGARPIIVGDEKDIEHVIGVSRDSNNRHQILLSSENGDTQTIDCSAQFNNNVATQVGVVIVGLGQEDSIKSAYTLSISVEQDDTILSRTWISESRLKEIAEQIVSGKFEVDSLIIKLGGLNETGNNISAERSESLLGNEPRALVGGRKPPEPKN